MTDRAALIAAIAAAPDDNLPRLVFADWLEEHGEPERAAFIRASVEVLRYFDDDPRMMAPAARADELFQANWRDWVRPLLVALTGSPGPEFRDHLRKRYHLAPGPVDQPGRSFGLRSRNDESDCHSGYPIGVSYSRGMVWSLALVPADDPGRGSLEEAFTVEPITDLHLNGAGLRGRWGRFRGAGLKQLRSVCINFGGGDTTLLDEVLASPSLTGVSSFGLTGTLVTRGSGTMPEWELPGGATESVVRSPFLSQISRFELWATVEQLRLIASTPTAFGFRTLKFVNLGSARRSSDRVGGLGAVLADATFRPNLWALDVRGCSLGPGGVARLFDADWPQLVRLTLATNGIGLQGVEILTSEAPPYLRELDLGYSNLGDAEAIVLARIAGRLTQLFLQNNTIGGRGALALADALDPGWLEWLDLSRNPISPPVADRLRERFGPRVLVD